MLLTIGFAPTRLRVERGMKRRQKEQIARAAATLGLTSTRTDLDSLLASIGRGGVYYPARLNDEALAPTVENFHESNVVVLDIDNTNPQNELLSWQEALHHPYIQAHAAFLHESPNYSAEQNRFRIGFVLPQVVSDYQSYKQIAERILENVLGTQYPRQGELITRPTWGYKGCRSKNIGGKRTQVLSNREFERLTNDIAEQQQQRKRRSELAQVETGKISIEEAEKMLACIPFQLDYAEWQNIVFGIANYFEEHEAVQLVQNWSPGRDRKYIELIQRAQRRKYAAEGIRRITIATVIDVAKRYGYLPPRPQEQPPEALRYDRTITVNRWVSEAAAELFPLIDDHPRTLIVSRTGNGKSRFVELLSRRGRVLLVSPLAKLAEQQATEFHETGAVSVTGGEQQEIAEAYFRYRDFVCTTPEMLSQYMQLVDGFDYVVLDETHELRRMSYRPAALAVMTELLENARRIVGLTATPTDNIFREQGFFMVNVADRRNDRLQVHVREFSGGSPDNNGNDSTALVARLIREHVETSTPQEATTEPKPVMVIRLQSKKQLRVVQDYCRSILNLPEDDVAVLTSDNKNTNPVFSAVVEKRRIPDGIRLVLTTSVFDLGLNVLNTNIARLILIEPQDSVEVIQFSARFRNVNVPVECFYRRRKDDTPRPEWNVDLLARYRRDYNKSLEIIRTLNAARHTGDSSIYNRVSAIFKYNRFIQRSGENYEPNTLYIAAHLYRESTRAAMASNDRFFASLAQQYSYCDILRLDLLDLDADVQVHQLKEQLKEQEKDIEEALYTALRQDKTTFFVNVFHAYGADRDLHKRLLKEWEGYRQPEDEDSKAIKRRVIERFGENIFARPLARSITRRFLHLRSLKISSEDAVRLVDTARTPERWHNVVTEFETMLRQYLWQNNPTALSPKWRREAEAVATLASTLQQKQQILTTDVLTAVNDVMHRYLFAMKKREAAKLLRILFGEFRRRGRQKITYYDCSHKNTFETTLRRFGIDAAAYLQTLQITARFAPVELLQEEQTDVLLVAEVDSE